MRIGLFQDLRNPPAWRRPWDQFYGEVFERIEAAEQLGIDSIWGSEHHFFEDGYMSQPMLFAAVVAARTKRIGIGTAILIAPLRPALEIAEQATLVDIVSGGRFQLGLGAGYRIPEFAAFGVDVKRRWEMLEERIREIRRLWDEGVIVPPPVQTRIPIWVGALGPRTARIAGRTGEGLQWLNQDQLQPYLEGLKEGGHDPASGRLCGPAGLIVADDPEKVWAEIKPNLGYQWSTYATYGAEGTDKAGALIVRDLDTTVDPETLRSPGPAMVMPAFDVVTPDECVARLTAWLSPMPAVEVFFWDSIAGMREELVHRHIELLATQVAPRVADLGV